MNHQIELTLLDIYMSEPTESLLYILKMRGLPVSGTFVLSPDFNKIKRLKRWHRMKDDKLVYEWEEYEDEE